jgi:hypothetical protein
LLEPFLPLRPPFGLADSSLYRLCRLAFALTLAHTSGHLLETLDLLYDIFGQKRCSEDWTKELAKVQQWLQHEERNPRAAE